LGQAEVKLDSVFSADDKLNHKFSTYLGRVQNQRTTATLLPSKIEDKSPKNQELEKTIPQESLIVAPQVALCPTIKPVARQSSDNPLNPDKEMLGESLMLSFPQSSQSIKLLLPPKQKAPLSNYGESVIIKFSKVQIGSILSYHLIT